MKKLIFFKNSLGAKPRAGREYRFVDPETVRTVHLMIADDCGSGSKAARVETELYKRLHRVDSSNPQLNADVENVQMGRDEYPVLLRGCDLDSNAQVIDVRTYHAALSGSGVK